MTTNNENGAQRDIPAPKYRVLSETPVNPGRNANADAASSQTKWHIKLAVPHIARMIDSGKYVEVEYAHVQVSHILKTDADGEFSYNETQITASDEDGSAFPAYMYFAHRALALDEALFAIGELG